MHKPALTLSLFLMGTLIMLVPFTSINFPNAMAQGYYDDSYSTYPTDDKKYECRTGPFEGFFVSSVEFCKHLKFDKDKDRKDVRDRDNKTGAQGPPGPQGPPGALAVNDTNLYFVQGNITGAGAANINQSSIAFCNAGDVVFEGGWDLVFPNIIGGAQIITDGSITPTNSTINSAYKVEFVATTGSIGTYQAFAYCLNNP